MKYLIILIFLTGFSGIAQNDNWKKLAEKNVAFKGETDKVTLTGNERTVDKIKIKCVQGTVQLKKIKIVMEGGKEKEYDARGVGILTKGMSSTAFAVPDKDDKVKRIELDYDSKGNVVLTKRAKVEILGKKDRDED
ncbi:hypothetical protein GCM10023115_38590 [Pontixanthobacter gangjinensis]|uniref:DUF2541 domain-containing protein n=1 Tax=Christiangramia aestuarii TaxID=1028746 RepID=A0A7M3SWM3_9FLAO|nr:DUF2541 domain-containing protein [Christiangramia aestuarii]MUP41004.1 DUF2541 domain-containing protein [Christiangramia aestuarii]